jgi:hypothetical protein
MGIPGLGIIKSTLLKAGASAPAAAKAAPKMTPELAAYLASLGQAPPPEEPTYYDDGGGYAADDGGGYGGPAPLPSYDPNTDPSYLNLMSQLGLAESQSRVRAGEAITRAKLEGAIAAPRIGEQGVETRRGINNNWEGRGLFRSGARLRDLAIQQRGETQRLGDLERGTANRVAGINTELDDQISQLAQKRAEAAFQATMRAVGG